MNSNRDLSFDFIKGFLIFLVCWGHVLTIREGHWQNETFLLIYSFHMPLFILVSGYFGLHTVQQGVRNTLTKRTQRLLVPAVIWSSIFLCIFMLDGEGFAPRTVVDAIRGAWFLYCLYCLYLWASTFWDSKYRYWIAAAIAMALVLAYPYWPAGLRHFVCYFQLTHQWPVFVIGLYLAEHRVLNAKPGGVRLCLLLIATIIYVSYLIFGIFMHKPEWKLGTHETLHVIVSPCGAIVWLVLLKMVYPLIKRLRLTRVFVSFGSATLGIYMLNGHIIIRLIPHGAELNWYEILLLAIAVTIVCYGITLLLKRNLYTKEYLLGEK